jgi:hypothetical protein
MLGDRRYCYPLTITDFASRYLLTCEALTTTQEKFAFTAFEQTFQAFGLPETIRTDNGIPFASGQAPQQALGVVATHEAPTPISCAQCRLVPSTQYQTGGRSKAPAPEQRRRPSY